jgi:hypothetical protein
VIAAIKAAVERVITRSGVQAAVLPCGPHPLHPRGC